MYPGSMVFTVHLIHPLNPTFKCWNVRLWVGWAKTLISTVLNVCAVSDESVNKGKINRRMFLPVEGQTGIWVSEETKQRQVRLLSDIYKILKEYSCGQFWFTAVTVIYFPSQYFSNHIYSPSALSIYMMCLVCFLSASGYTHSLSRVIMITYISQEYPPTFHDFPAGESNF